MKYLVSQTLFHYPTNTSYHNRLVHLQSSDPSLPRCPSKNRTTYIEVDEDFKQHYGFRICAECSQEKRRRIGSDEPWYIRDALVFHAIFIYTFLISTIPG